jgi:hypothetical protein
MIPIEDEAPEVRALGQRLVALTFPEGETLAARVIRHYRGDGRADTGGRGRAPRRRRVLPAAAVALALVALLIATGAGSALAGSPLVTPVVAKLLAVFGVERPVALAASATSSGETMTLAAGYADAVRTAVVVQVSPSEAQPLDATLTDAVGDVQHAGPAFIGGQGHMVITFGPLAHPRPGGNSLTLHVTELLPMAAGKGQPGGVPPPVKPITGDWTLRFTLDYGGGQVLPAPAPGRLGQVTVTFEAVAASSDTFHVRFVTTGATFDQLIELGPLVPCAAGVQCVQEPQRPPGPTPFRFQLFDPAGREMGPFMESGGDGKGFDTSDRIEWDQLYHTRGAGTYRIVVSWQGHRFERDVTVR